MTRKQKRMLIRILIAAVLFLAALITDHTLHPSMWIVLPIFAAAYLVVGSGKPFATFHMDRFSMKIS